MIEYVVVHELCHLIYADHSARFWALVASCLPDCKQRQIALNRMEHHPESALITVLHTEIREIIC